MAPAPRTPTCPPSLTGPPSTENDRLRKNEPPMTQGRVIMARGQLAAATVRGMAPQTTKSPRECHLSPPNSETRSLRPPPTEFAPPPSPPPPPGPPPPPPPPHSLPLHQPPPDTPETQHAQTVEGLPVRTPRDSIAARTTTDQVTHRIRGQAMGLTTINLAMALAMAPVLATVIHVVIVT